MKNYFLSKHKEASPECNSDEHEYAAYSDIDSEPDEEFYPATSDSDDDDYFKNIFKKKIRMDQDAEQPIKKRFIKSSIGSAKGGLLTPLKSKAVKRWQLEYFRYGKRPSIDERREFLIENHCSPSYSNRLVWSHFVFGYIHQFWQFMTKGLTVGRQLIHFLGVMEINCHRSSLILTSFESLSKKFSTKNMSLKLYKYLHILTNSIVSFQFF